MRNYFKAMGTLCSIVAFLAVCTACSLFSKPAIPRISTLDFEKEEITLAVGEMAAIKITLGPEEAIESYEVLYTEVAETPIVALSEKSSSGIIIKGMLPGKTIVSVTCDGITDYLIITVDGSIVMNTPYIILPTQVSDITLGTKKTFSVSLYGGTIADNSEFTWAVADETIATITATSNTVVVEAVKAGTTKIKITHPKATYEAEILIFSSGIEETPVYITSEQNVITSYLGGTNKQLYVNLAGGQETDNNAFQFTIDEGADVITIINAENSCNITPLKQGLAKITVTHPKAEYPITILVVVVGLENTTYMEVNTSLLTLIGTEGQIIEAEFVGSAPPEAYTSFTYTVTDPGVITIQQVNNSFYVTGIQTGTTVLQISNPYVTYSREVLVRVQDLTIISNEKYITTSQNVIQLEENGTSTTLSMMLIGGTAGDNNAFEWEVSDSTIINLTTGDGTVTYDAKKNTQQTSSRGIEEGIVSASAMVNPGKSGIAYITIKNPKAIAPCKILVKVYPKGTYETIPVLLTSGTSLIKVLKGGTTNVVLSVSSGNKDKIDALSWTITDQTKATVVNTTMEGVITGVNSGITDLTIQGAALYKPYVAKIMVGTQAELDSNKAIYVDNTNPIVLMDEPTYIQIKSNKDLLLNNPNFTVTNANEDILLARMINDVLIVQGVSPGDATIVVSNTEALNTIEMKIKVEPKNINLNYPYYIQASNFIGVVLNSSKTLTATLVGAPSSEADKITWEIADATIATILGNGTECSIQTLKLGQTAITIKQPKCMDAKTVILYVAATEAELANAFVMTTNKMNYLIDEGESIFVSILSNGTSAQKALLEWNMDVLDIVSINSNYNSAYIKGIKEGNVVLTITQPNSLIPLKIYISVKKADDIGDGKSIHAPAILEMLIGQNKVMTILANGFTEAEKNNITWSIDNPTIATVSGTGVSAHIIAKIAGQTYVNINYVPLGYQKKILLITALTSEELASNHVLATDKAYYRMAIGDENIVTLLTGLGGFPELDRPAITWVSSNENILKVYPNGIKGTLKALNAGIVTVTINHINLVTPVIITIDVSDTILPNENGYKITGTLLHGIVTGQQKTITVNIVDKNNVVIPELNASLLWSIGEPAIASLTANGNTGVVAANSVGQTYITITHPLIAGSIKILIYTDTSLTNLSNQFPLATSKNYYVLNIGQTEYLNVDTINDLAENLTDIQWAISNTSAITYQTVTKKQLKITAKNSGNIKITVSHVRSNKPVEIYVSIRNQNASTDVMKSIVTESIIGIVKGQVRNTQIITNMTPEELLTLEWKSNSETIATVVSNGSQAEITGVNLGETTIEIKYSETVRRRIVVYVVATEAELYAYKAMNIDNMYRKIGIGEELKLAPYFAPVAHAIGDNTVWTDVYNNNVVQIIAGINDTAVIQGLHEGIATIQITNPSCSKPIILYIQVDNSSSTSVTEYTEMNYLTISKTIYILDPTQTTVAETIAIDPIGLSSQEITGIEWKNNNPEIFTLFGNGKTCDVFPNKIGTGTITVSHPKSQNLLQITIVVGVKENIINENSTFVSTNKGVIESILPQTAEITCQLNNVAQPDNGLFTATIDNATIASISTTGNVITITPKKAGQALITIANPQAQYSAKVVYICKSENAAILYLTTNDNYSIVGTEKYASIGVQLIGKTETDASKFTWTSINTDIATITGNGPQVLVNGIKPGIARIDVRHVDAPYPLSIYVQVATIINMNPVYISTANNIINVTEGSTSSLNVSLENGLASEASLFAWINNNPSAVSIIASGNTAVIKGLSAGNATITVSHPSSLNAINIVVVVEKDLTSSGIYIATDASLLEMKPADSAKMVSVRLVGGLPEDIYGFQWAVLNYTSVEKYNDGTSKPVIELIPGAETAYITSKNEGEAIIRVSHPKTSYKLDIKIKISLFNAIKFSSPTVTVDQGKATTLAIDVPTGSSIIYEVADKTIAAITGTSSICLIEGLKPGVTTVTARNTAGTTADELLVNVKAVPNAVVQYISCSTGLITLTTSQAPIQIKAALEGTGFVPGDSDAITWKSNNTALCTVFGQGSNCTITPKEVGETTIVITHPKIIGYQKTLYVKISTSDISYTISDGLKMLTEGDESVIHVTVNNVPNIDYNTDVVWATSDATIASAIAAGNGSMCAIIAKKAGTATITATYKTTVKTCTVIVAQKKGIFMNASAEVLPGQTIIIPYTVTPTDATVTYQTDSMNYVSVTHDTVAKQFKITGKSLEGYTVLTATTNGLATTCTIFTNFNYYFKPNIPSIRGVPKGSYEVLYTINPAGSDITIEPYDTTLMTVTKNIALQKIIVTPKKSGYGLIQMRSVVTNLVLKIPAYFYYENLAIPLLAEATTIYDKIKNLHSFVDPSQAAIRLGDGERLTLTPNISVATYPGNGVYIAGIVFTPSPTSGLPADFITVAQTENGTPLKPGKVLLSSKFCSDTGYGSETLKSTIYAGKIVITYKYYNGSESEATVTKSFLLYNEWWRRY